MSPQTETTSLVEVGLDAFGRPAKLAPCAARAWIEMREAAAKEEVRLLLLSAFRSVERQRGVLKKKLESGVLLADALRFVAFPGYSEHHTGRAIDIGSLDCAHLTEEFEGTRAYTWLARHAQRFGFSLSYPRENSAGIAYEPWHWFMREEKAQPGARANPRSCHDPC